MLISMQRLSFPSLHSRSSAEAKEPDAELGFKLHTRSAETNPEPLTDPLPFLERLYNLDRFTLHEYPGIVAYTRYLEASFQTLLGQNHTKAWEALGRKPPETTKDYWELFGVAASVVAELRTGKVTDFSKRVVEHYTELNQANHDDSRLAGSSMESVMAAELVSSVLFPILGWMTMITSPAQPEPGKTPVVDDSRFSIKTEGIFVSNKRISIERALTTALKRFHQNFAVPIWKTRARDSSPSADYLTLAQEEATLNVSCINLATLQDIAKVHIVWVNDIQSHLAFDKGQRRLCIFRFPSFCAVSALDSATPVTAPVLDALVSGTESHDYGDDHNGHLSGHRQLHQEILMSYRLIFGQEYSSRKKARKLLNKLEAGIHRSVGEETPAAQYDTMLEPLCTVSSKDKIIKSMPLCLWPPEFRSAEDELLEQSWYIVGDFPVFGKRLEYLQEFVLRQRPSRLTDMWRDKRNMLQWYTFWAVLVVGGLSLLIGILQLAVSIAQLVASY